MSFSFAFGVGIAAAAYINTGNLGSGVPHTSPSMVGIVYLAWYAFERVTVVQAAVLESSTDVYRS